MSERIVSNIHMSTRLVGHDCTFTWRLRNASLLKTKSRPVVQHDFALHPKCDSKWSIMLYGVDEGYELRVSSQSPKIPFVITSPNLNQKGDLVSPSESDYVLRMQLEGKETVVSGDGVEVEFEDDTLVMRGRMNVPRCCTETEMDMEETTVVPKNTELLDYLDLIKDGFTVVA